MNNKTMSHHQGLERGAKVTKDFHSAKFDL
jgi:hypothetical protein